MAKPFHDLREYMALPRMSALRVSPTGQVVVTAQALAEDRKKWVTALWQADPARRLTWSAEGESGAEFLPDGSLLFLSKRGGDVPALWRLPAGGGEAYKVIERPGGIDAVATATGADTIVFGADALSGDDAERRKERADEGVTAILHESYPVRFWNHDLGPGRRHLYVLDGSGDDTDARDLTPDPGQALNEQAFALTPDGSAVITGWHVPMGRGQGRTELVRIDVATGERRTLASAGTADFSSSVISPDGRHVICFREEHSRPEAPFEQTLWQVPVDGGEGHDLLPDLDLYPSGPAWAADGGIYFVADVNGRRPIFKLAGGEVTRVTDDDWSYSGLRVHGDTLYAMRSGIASPMIPVRVGEGPLDAPGGTPELPGTLTEVTATADDGQEIRGWLVLPESETPAPLLLWVHGGPFMSWNDWNWRWSPWLMAANGYAVLLPDPALSTGYGSRMVERGWANWGEVTHADLMAITDAAVARTDVDETRVGMMGGSFGGYMANWIAGHTDRFGAIVSHASLWDLRTMFSTSDESHWALREMGDPVADAEVWDRNDPARHIAKFRTPMLVIHGDKDYRVPIGNALWLWWDLTRHEVDAKFLYYPDEDHWVTTPGNAVVWYETVLAFLAHHLLGEEWRRPGLL